MRRNEFVRMVTLGAGYIAIAGCLGACKNKTAKTEEPAKASADKKAKSKVGFTIDLNDSKYAGLDKPGAYVYYGKIIIARTNEGELVAFSKKCTHQGGPLSYNAELGKFQCPWHGTEYSGKGVVTQGPASKPMKPYNVSKEDSLITITPKA